MVLSKIETDKLPMLNTANVGEISGVEYMNKADLQKEGGGCCWVLISGTAKILAEKDRTEENFIAAMMDSEEANDRVDRRTPEDVMRIYRWTDSYLGQ